MRKKISTNENNIGSVAELDDGEQLVIESSKTVRRERSPKPDPAPDPIDGDIITVEPEDDDDPDESPEYSDQSLAAMIYGDGDEPLENQFCTIAIRRNPDSITDRFVVPCSAVTTYPPMRNVEITADRMDIEEHFRVNNAGFGGHFFFQLHFNSRLRGSWKTTLSDDPAAVAAAKTQKFAASQPVIPPAAEPVNPIDAFLDNIEKQNRMRDLLFGSEQKRMEAEIADLRRENERTKDLPSEPKSEQLLILEKALAAPGGDLQDRLLEYAFPSSEGNRHWIADTVDVVLKNKDTIIGMLGPLLGLGAAPATAPEMNVADLMRMPAPGRALTDPPPQPAPSIFRRHKSKPETEEPDVEIAIPDFPIGVAENGVPIMEMEDFHPGEQEMTRMMEFVEAKYPSIDDDDYDFEIAAAIDAEIVDVTEAEIADAVDAETVEIVKETK